MITTLSAGPVGPTCRWCGEPIRPIDSGPRRDWVHTGPGGAFPCRDRLTGMALPTLAVPADAQPAIGRHRVPGQEAS